MGKMRKWELIILVVAVLVVAVLVANWWNAFKTDHSTSRLECKKGWGYTTYVYRNEEGKCIWYAKVKGESRVSEYSEKEFLIWKDDKVYDVERFEAMDTSSMKGIVKYLKNSIKYSELSDVELSMNFQRTKGGFLYYGENEGYSIYWYEDYKNEYSWYALVEGRSEHLFASKDELLIKQDGQSYRVELFKDVKGIKELGGYMTKKEWQQFKENRNESKLTKGEKAYSNGTLYNEKKEGYTIYLYCNEEDRYKWYAIVEGESQSLSYSEKELMISQNGQTYRVELFEDVDSIYKKGDFVTDEEWAEFEKNITYSKLEKVQN